jgi:hypothetical protein
MMRAKRGSPQRAGGGRRVPPVQQAELVENSVDLRFQYSQRTEKAYVMWVRRFVRFHDLRHPAGMAEPEINTFLTHLAVECHVIASTQNQALSALLFLYRHVLGREVGQLVDVIRARKPARLPVVMTRDEIRAVFKHLSGEQFLVALLMYGGGLPLLEYLRSGSRTWTSRAGSSPFATARPSRIELRCYLPPRPNRCEGIAST